MLQGIAASWGVGVGVAFVLERWTPSVPERFLPLKAVAVEVERLRLAVRRACQEVAAARDRLAGQGDQSPTELLDAIVSLHHDALLVDTTARLIEQQQINAEWALQRTVEALRRRLATGESSYLSERAEDIEQVGRQVQRALLADELALPQFSVPTVVVAKEIGPAELSQLAQPWVRGLVTSAGSSTCHLAILSRSLNLPTVVGVADSHRRVGNGQRLLVDATSGYVIVEPEERECQTALTVAKRYRQTSSRPPSSRPPSAKTSGVVQTSDGVDIELWANAEQPADLQAALSAGVVGIGLYRSEFAGFGVDGVRDEEAQYVAYRQAVEALAPRQVVFRTFDHGADKENVWLGAEGSAGFGSALGLRGLRRSLQRPAEFCTQLRALLRAAAHGAVKILLPMVTQVQEVQAVRSIMEQCRAELIAGGMDCGSVACGAMIEVPAAVMTLDALAMHCDFFAVGSNDLVQYTLAVDRNNPEVAHLARSLDPAMLRMLRMISDAGDKHRIAVSICGDMVVDPVALPVLVGLGYRRLSVPVAFIEPLSQVIANLDLSMLQKLAAKALECSHADEVRELVLGDLNQHWQAELIGSRQG